MSTASQSILILSTTDFLHEKTPEVRVHVGGAEVADHFIVEDVARHGETVFLKGLFKEHHVQRHLFDLQIRHVAVANLETFRNVLVGRDRLEEIGVAGLDRLHDGRLVRVGGGHREHRGRSKGRKEGLLHFHFSLE